MDVIVLQTEPDKSLKRKYAQLCSSTFNHLKVLAYGVSIYIDKLSDAKWFCNLPLTIFLSQIGDLHSNFIFKLQGQCTWNAICAIIENTFATNRNK